MHQYNTHLGTLTMCYLDSYESCPIITPVRTYDDKLISRERYVTDVVGGANINPNNGQLEKNNKKIHKA